MTFGGWSRQDEKWTQVYELWTEYAALMENIMAETITVTETNKPDSKPYGLYKTPDGYYYWHYVTYTQGNDCVWLSSTLSHGFIKDARSGSNKDVKVTGTVSITFD